jgi:hypothetical protein
MEAGMTLNRSAAGAGPGDPSHRGQSPRFFTIAEVAKFVGMVPRTGSVYCKLGRRVVYRPADLEQWLQSRTTRDTSDADARFLKALTAAHPR